MPSDVGVDDLDDLRRCRGAARDGRTHLVEALRPMLEVVVDDRKRLVDDRPVPNSTRPSEMRSSTEADSAERTGWLYGFGNRRTPYPRRMFFVFIAMAP